METATLPIVNERGFYEIRLEAIGGLGANLAGKMLAEAGVSGAGLNGVSFSSYGSEKKGSPVKAHIRFCAEDRPIRDTSPVEQAHIVGVFHEALLQTPSVAGGMDGAGILLVNSAKAADEVQALLGGGVSAIAVVDASAISFQEKNRVNMAMLGALFRLCPFLSPDQMKAVIARSLDKKYPQAVDSALRTFDRGYAEMSVRTFASEARRNEAKKREAASPTALGYETQPIGGMIVNPGGSFLKDLSISRSGVIPAYENESCINCAECDTVCPDQCFVWEAKVNKKGRSQMFLKGIDYQYCKGCLKCVEACPTSALSAIKEQPGYAARHSVPHAFDRAEIY